MKMHEAIRVELAPRGRKLDLLRRHCGLSRFVWNWALAKHEANGWPIGGKRGAADRKAAVEAKKRGEDVKLAKKISAPELSRMWTQEIDGTAPWARELARSTVTYAIKAVDDAYKHAFRRAKAKQKSGFPKFRGRSHTRRGFTLQDQSFRHTTHAIKLGKIGMVPIRNARRHDPLDRLEGARALRLVVEERAGRWWCSIMVEREVEEPVPRPAKHVIGVDLGFVLTTSKGLTYEPPKALDRYLRWIQRWGRAVSRRTKPGQPSSKRREKAKLVLARLHLRVAEIRRDWLHEVSHDLTKYYDVIVTEGFDVARFVEYEVATTDNRRTVLDIGWGMLRTFIAYKAERRGALYMQLGKHELTDQTCSRCGGIDPRTTSEFLCESCGHRSTRRRNTADLMERVGRGDPPEGFGADQPRSPSGEDGVKTRGDSGRHGGRSRRSEPGHVEPQRDPGVNGSHFSKPNDHSHSKTKKKARKKGVSTCLKARASAQVAKPSEQQPIDHLADGLNGVQTT